MANSFVPTERVIGPGLPRFAKPEIPPAGPEPQTPEARVLKTLLATLYPAPDLPAGHSADELVQHVLRLVGSPRG